MRQRGDEARALSQATQNPSVKKGQYKSAPGRQASSTNGNSKTVATRRYYVPSDDGGDWPPELEKYNKNFAETLEKIKRRHDSVVTTVGTHNFSILVLSLSPRTC